MTGAEIRESFLAYFEERGHRRVRSSSLIPAGDPTLLFTNAGMVQFKDVFLGTDRRDYKRAASSQKCVRAGGKHNDLENVGRTARHHTFFEMLGNFSFGDYFKEEAIGFGWEFLVDIVGLPVDKLWVSVFREDGEAADIWKNKIGLPVDRIVRLGEKDNFWAMGDTGPCGPCSEIIIDQGEEVSCGKPSCGLECDCDRYLELWNLVFMQFNRDADGNMTPLPRPSIDTGLGLERLAAVVQGKKSNFQTDLFTPIIGFIEGTVGAKIGQSEEKDVSIRVIADHLRAAAFLVSDGVIPSNEGRGYVLRRIIRRAGRHGYLLGRDKSILSLGVPVLAESMGDVYPELKEHLEYTVKMIGQEEERFLSTLEAGLGILGGVIGELKAGGGKVVPGEKVFRLYDTYGFPVDLSEDIAAEEGFTLDMEGFARLMEEQRKKARAAWAGSGEEGLKDSWREMMEKLPPTEFTGYHADTGSAKVLALIVGDKEVNRAEEGQQVEIVLDRTPFYGEAGGQIGDSGLLKASDLAVEVTDTRRLSENFVIHRGLVMQGVLEVGMEVQASVDGERRRATARNHTATHLLQAALQKVLGDHVRQSGSLVTPEKLRFDFTHFTHLSPEELREVESMVNDAIRRNMPVGKKEMSIDEAMESGAMAIFGEKYGESVRVVKVEDFSAELCGGIHIDRTGDIGLFKITHESSVAAGVRRIEALTGQGALEAVWEEDRLVRELSALLKTGRDGLIERISRMQEEIRELQRKKEKEASRSTSSMVGDLLSGVEEAGGVKIVVARAEGLDMKSLREMVDRLKDRLGDAAVFLAAPQDDRLLMAAGSSGKALEKVNAGNLVGQVAALAGGKGGGRPDFAQAGARQVEDLEKLLSQARDLIKENLS